MSSMRFHIVTIFPNMFESYFAESIISRAIKNKLLEINTYALRDFTVDKHRRVDGRPYGGGPGMVMWADPIIKCVEHIKKKLLKIENCKLKIIILSPGGEMFTNTIAKQSVKKYTDIIFICGRYEGIDARVKKILKAKEWSVGPYVLTGGELPAMICVDAIARHIKGTLHAEDSIEENRVASHEIYARPEIYVHKGKKYKVPKVLLGGNHKEIENWRKKEVINEPEGGIEPPTSSLRVKCSTN
jgi:tRNA (guanine37-N1)-methyltransferase